MSEREARREYARRYYNKNKERLRAHAKKYARAHKHIYRQACKEYRRRLRDLVFEAYGRECRCCGNNYEPALAIDHIDGRGSAHRKKIGSGGDNLTRWLVKQRFPKGFQILCVSCNWIKGTKRKCPCKGLMREYYD